MKKAQHCFANVPGRVPGRVPGCPGGLPATGAKSKALPQEHLGFASGRIGPHPKPGQNWLRFAEQGLVPCAARCFQRVPAAGLAGRAARGAPHAELGARPGRGCGGRSSGRAGPAPERQHGSGPALGSAPGTPPRQGSSVAAEKPELPSVYQELDPLVWSCVSVREGSSGVHRASQKQGNACAGLPVRAVCSAWLPARGEATRNFSVQFWPFLSRFIRSGAFKW